MNATEERLERLCAATLAAPTWQRVWREGIAPQLNVTGLTALLDALREDSPRLIQGATVEPPPLPACADWPVECACVLGYALWHGERLKTVADLERRFAEVCAECDRRMGEPASVRWLLNWADETPRVEMRLALATEVNRALARRE